MIYNTEFDPQKKQQHIDRSRKSEDLQKVFSQNSFERIKDILLAKQKALLEENVAASFYEILKVSQEENFESIDEGDGCKSTSSGEYVLGRGSKKAGAESMHSDSAYSYDDDEFINDENGSQGSIANWKKALKPYYEGMSLNREHFKKNDNLKSDSSPEVLNVEGVNSDTSEDESGVNAFLKRKHFISEDFFEGGKSCSLEILRECRKLKSIKKSNGNSKCLGLRHILKAFNDQEETLTFDEQKKIKEFIDPYKKFLEEINNNKKDSLSSDSSTSYSSCMSKEKRKQSSGSLVWNEISDSYVIAVSPKKLIGVGGYYTDNYGVERVPRSQDKKKRARSLECLRNSFPF